MSKKGKKHRVRIMDLVTPKQVAYVIWRVESGHWTRAMGKAELQKLARERVQYLVETYKDFRLPAGTGAYDS